MMPQVEGLCYIAEFLALLLTFIIINKYNINMDE